MQTKSANADRAGAKSGESGGRGPIIQPHNTKALELEARLLRRLRRGRFWRLIHVATAFSVGTPHRFLLTFANEVFTLSNLSSFPIAST